MTTSPSTTCSRLARELSASAKSPADQDCPKGLIAVRVFVSAQKRPTAQARCQRLTPCDVSATLYQWPLLPLRRVPTGKVVADLVGEGRNFFAAGFFAAGFFAAGFFAAGFFAAGFFAAGFFAVDFFAALTTLPAIAIIRLRLARLSLVLPSGLAITHLFLGLSRTSSMSNVCLWQYSIGPYLTLGIRAIGRLWSLFIGMTRSKSSKVSLWPRASLTTA